MFHMGSKVQVKSSVFYFSKSDEMIRFEKFWPIHVYLLVHSNIEILKFDSRKKGILPN